MVKANQTKNQKSSQADIFIECEVLRGLKDFAVKEIGRTFGRQARFIADEDLESVKFFFSGKVSLLLQLRTVVAVYAGVNFRIRGPHALLAAHNFQEVVHLMRLAASLHPKGAFKSFRFSAAGDDSLVFQKMRTKIITATGLSYYPDDGDHLLRIRPTEYGQWGWDVLVRLSPLPLSVRPWRIANMPGAVNATVAASMVQLTHPQPADTFINLMCGSATLLIERLMAGKAAQLVGVDNNPESLEKARINIKAARFSKGIELELGDATGTGFADSSFDKLVADLPWGQLIGRHTDNEILYPAVLKEAARIAAPFADFVVLTHDIIKFEKILAGDKGWETKAVYQISQGGKHPKIYHLKKVI